MDRSIPTQLRFLATVGDGARHTSCRGPISQTAGAHLLQPLQQKPLLFAFVPLCKSVGQVHYRVIASGQGTHWTECYHHRAGVRRLRQAWPKMHIILHVDDHFVNPRLLALHHEDEQLDFLFWLDANKALIPKD